MKKNLDKLNNNFNFSNYDVQNRREGNRNFS